MLSSGRHDVSLHSVRDNYRCTKSRSLDTYETNGSKIRQRSACILSINTVQTSQRLINLISQGINTDKDR